MIAANLTRITALTSIPLAYILSSLTLVHLMVVATILGLSTVFFDVAYQSYVPMIASKRYIGAANGRLEASYQVGLAGGPGLGGWLLGIVAAPLVYLLTAATYVASTWAIWRIRTPEPTPVRSDATLGARYARASPSCAANAFSTRSFPALPPGPLQARASGCCCPSSCCAP